MWNCIVSIFTLTIVGISSFVNAGPCDNIEHVISKERADSFSVVIAKQLQAKNVDVLRLFSFDQWAIIYVDTHEADEAFLFYEGDPLTSRFVTLWSGAATRNEENQIKEWVVKNAPGIPIELANCFAWKVTKNRDL